MEYNPPCRPLVYYPRREEEIYNFDQFLEAKRLRAEAGNRGVLLPPMPCISRGCMACEQFREFWDRQFNPKTLALF